MNFDKLRSATLPLFRRKRMKHFVQTFKPDERTRILDIGGTVANWQLIESPFNITILNLFIPDDTMNVPSNLSFALGDGTALCYKDNSFDIAFSNSVIEHLYTWENQKRFASEVRRVARSVWVQTPARSFFVEMHLFTPFIHYLPKSWQRRLIKHFTLMGLMYPFLDEEIDQFLREVRLLSHKEMIQLFPDCDILRERFLFFTKAFIAIRLNERMPVLSPSLSR